VSSPVPDEADIDLLQMKCIDAEAQRDDAIEARDDAVETLNKALNDLETMREALQTAIQERDAAVNKLNEWKEEAVSARRLILLAMEQLP
jgi:uncharacterized protein (DUF3084 family)